MWKGLSIIITACAIYVQCNPLEEIYNCGENIKCAEEKLIGVIDDYDKTSSISILGDLLSIDKTEQEATVPKSQESIEERIFRFINNHEIRVKFPSSQRRMRSMIDEARKSKLKKIILPLLLFLKLKTAIILPAILFAIALVAFKGLGAGLMALLLSGAVAMKSLLEKHGSSTISYEVVPQIAGPHWSRSGIEGMKFAPSYNTISH